MTQNYIHAKIQKSFRTELKHDDDIQTVITFANDNGYQNFFDRIEATLEKPKFMMSDTFLFFIIKNKKNEV